jgi:hypothetical protein
MAGMAACSSASSPITAPADDDSAGGSTSGSVGGGTSGSGTSGSSAGGTTGSGSGGWPVITGTGNTGNIPSGTGGTVNISICPSLSCPSTAPAGSGSTPLISTFGNTLVTGSESKVEGDNRLGYWFTYNDGTPGATQNPTGSTFMPSSPGQDDNYAARTWGSGFQGSAAGKGWTGAGMGLNFNNGCAYNASAYKGITFWAKGSVTGSVRFSVTQASTTFAGDNAGGTCCSQGDRTKSAGCSDHFGATITLSANWTQYTYTWSQLNQNGWGILAAQNPAELLGVQWQVSDAAATASFDIWVDALAFTT